MDKFLNITDLMAANTPTNNITLVKCFSDVLLIPWDSSSYNEAVKVSTILALSVNVVTMPLTIFFNALIIFLVYKNSCLQVERFIVLAYLALTDFLSGLICQPLLIAREIFHLKNKAPNCALDTAFAVCTFLFVGASFSQLVIVTYERYVAIIHPYKYPTRITVQNLTCATIGLWTVNIAKGLLLFSFAPLQVYSYIDIFDVLSRIIMMSCIIYWYVKIFAAMKRHNRQILLNSSKMST
jgi:hypothetical protein